MKGKKKEENVDVTNLPKINTFNASMIFSSENPEKRLKLLETIFKSNHKFIRLIPRENLIEFAKEKGIFVEPAENKKDPNPADKREINSEELAKAAAAIITDRSIPMMRDKKTLMEKIEELKKQKEEAIQARDHPQPVDPKKPPKPADKAKSPPVNPDDIIIPIIDEYAIDLGVVFYNYPLDHEEALALEKEHIPINHLLLLKDIDEYIPPEEPKEDPNADPKAKKAQPPPAKDAKAGNNDEALMRKYFSPPTKTSEEIFYELKKSKYLSEGNSLLRLIYFDIWEFSSKTNASSAPSSATPNNSGIQKKDAYTNFIDLYADKVNYLNKFLIHYLKWSSETTTIKLNEFIDDPALQRQINESLVQKLILETDMKKKDFEHMSVGALLISLYIDLVKHMREINHIGEHNMIIYEKNDIDNLFEDLEKEIIYEYSADTKASSNPPMDNENMMNSHIISEHQREMERHEQDINKIDELSSYFKLIIDEKDLILKNALDNEIEKFMLGEREKAFNLFRKFPGIGRDLMPDVPPKEENFRKAKKCEIYPFLDSSIGIPLYEKYDIVMKFEDILKEKITEYNFDFGDRIYQEIMNRDLLTQTLGNAMLYDTESLFFYNERDDNLLFSTYYRCPKGRIYRRTNKYKYLSKPMFENWINCFKPVFNEKINKHGSKEEINNNQELNMSSGKSKPGTPIGNNQTQAHIINDMSAIQGGPNDMSNQDLISNHNNFLGIGNNKNDKKPEIIFGNGYNPETHLLYETDDIYLGEVTERIKYMFPSDNGVFIKKVIENGIFKSYNSYVLKDNLVFGIKKIKENIPEFWMRFDNDVVMTVNYIGDYDSFKENYDSKNGTYTNFTFKNGLNIQILPNGDICQKIEILDDNSLVDCETHRIITSKASIISHFKMSKTNILYANGNVCTIQGGTSINTNNKGYRVAKRLQDGFEYEMDPVAITIQSDPETNSKLLIKISNPYLIL